MSQVECLLCESVYDDTEIEEHLREDHLVTSDDHPEEHT